MKITPHLDFDTAIVTTQESLFLSVAKEKYAITCTSLLHQSRFFVESCKVALEGDVSWHHGDASTHTFKSTSSSIVPACEGVQTKLKCC